MVFKLRNFGCSKWPERVPETPVAWCLKDDCDNHDVSLSENWPHKMLSGEASCSLLKLQFRPFTLRFYASPNHCGRSICSILSHSIPLNLYCWCFFFPPPSIQKRPYHLSHHGKTALPGAAVLPRLWSMAGQPLIHQGELRIFQRTPLLRQNGGVVLHVYVYIYTYIYICTDR